MRIAERVWCTLHPRSSPCLFARVCRATCAFWPMWGACSGHGRCAGQRLVCVCVASALHTDPFLTTGLIWSSASPSQLASSLANPVPSRRPAWRVSSVVPASLSKAPVSQPIVPCSKSAVRQHDPPQTTAEPLPPSTLRSPHRPLVSPSPEGVRLLSPSL